MKNIKDVVLECFNRLLKEKGFNIFSTSDIQLSRENGIDSLGLVELILDIEENLGIVLDTYLIEIRGCKTIDDMICVIERICSEY